MGQRARMGESDETVQLLASLQVPDVGLTYIPFTLVSGEESGDGALYIAGQVYKESSRG
jgi:hypothetical protein